MTTTLSKTRNGSFRYETTSSTTDPVGIVAVSSVSNNQHVLTSGVDSYCIDDDVDIITGKGKPIHHNDKDHSNDLHCHNEATSDMNHGHISYTSRSDLMSALKRRSPKEQIQLERKLKTKHLKGDVDEELWTIKAPSKKSGSMCVMM